jgi:phage terminase large subunit GpA-like protein
MRAHEVQILGFGAFEETWAARYEVLPGDPAQRQVWDLLDGVLAEPYRTEAGRELRVRVTCVDSGGHHQHQVLSYCGLRRSRGVRAIKGVAGPRAAGRLERLPGGACTHWKAPPLHGAHPERTLGPTGLRPRRWVYNH